MVRYAKPISNLYSCTVALLRSVQRQSGLYFSLEDNIDFASQPLTAVKSLNFMFGDSATNTDFYNVQRDGDRKVFNGNGFTLRNIVIVDSEKDVQGLFERVFSVFQFKHENISVKGRNLVGGLCAVCELVNNVRIKNLTVEA